MSEPTTAAGRTVIGFLADSDIRWPDENTRVGQAIAKWIARAESEARAQVVAEYNDGPSGPALIPNGEPCPICGPRGHGRHEDDSYGACVICYEYQPHTDMQYNKVAFPCAVVRESEARAAALAEGLDVERPCYPSTTHRYRRVGRSVLLCCVRCGQGKRDRARFTEIE